MPSLAHDSIIIETVELFCKQNDYCVKWRNDGIIRLWNKDNAYLAAVRLDHDSKKATLVSGEMPPNSLPDVQDYLNFFANIAMLMSRLETLLHRLAQRKNNLRSAFPSPYGVNYDNANNPSAPKSQ